MIDRPFDILNPLEHPELNNFLWSNIYRILTKLHLHAPTSDFTPGIPEFIFHDNYFLTTQYILFCVHCTFTECSLKVIYYEVELETLHRNDFIQVTNTDE